MKKILLLFFIFSLFLSFNLGCNINEDDDEKLAEELAAEILEEKKDSDFTAETKNQAVKAVFSLPDSLVTRDTENSKKKKNRSDEDDNEESDSGIADIYSGITCYIGIADEMGELVKEIMGHMLDPDFIKNATVGEIFKIEDEESEEDDPKSLKLEEGTDFDWKVTMYFDEQGTDPMGSIKFSIFADNENWISGQFTFLTRETEDLSEVEITEKITIIRKVEVNFETLPLFSENRLEIKIYQDLNPLKTYFDSHKDVDLTEQQYEALDLGQPSSLVVKAIKNTSTGMVTVYGSSYHPYWGIDSGDFEAPGIDLGDDRQMYFFKAIAKETETFKGAKIYLSFPTNTLSDLTNVWEDDSISQIYGDVFLSAFVREINADITLYNDDNDDPDTIDDDNTDPLGVNVAAEKLQAKLLINLIRGETDDNSLYDAVTNDTITADDVRAFMNNENTHRYGAELKTSLASFSKIINPALFGIDSNGESIFLGTYDETKELYYNYSSNLFSNGAEPDSTEASTLQTIIETFAQETLSDSNLYLPSEVSEMNLNSISVE